MKLKKIIEDLGLSYSNRLNGIGLYDDTRRRRLKKFSNLYLNEFQSPTINPSTRTQRSKNQKVEEHSVYQRSDYTPLLLENTFNFNFKKIGYVLPKTLAFNSGMGTISSLMYFLVNYKKVKKISVGENVYFETDWIMKHYDKFDCFNEYKLNISKSSDVYWLEYPINCTKPDKYPFNEQLNLKKFFSQFLKIVESRKKKQFYLVIDFTLFYVPFEIWKYINKLPSNLSVFLVSSLQKHRGYGFDLTNGGILTYYSHTNAEDYEEFTKIRAITGTSITQETVWLMPELKQKTINKIVKDSGIEAKRIYEKCNDIKPQVSLFYADNGEFLTSFIFVKIGKELMKKSIKKPYFSDLLIREIIKAAKKNKTLMLNGTSFGFPFTRIFKNSERYENTDSLRIAVGYDKYFNRGVAKSITEGIKVFKEKYGS